MKLKELRPHFSTYEPIGDKVLLALPRVDVNEMVATDGGILVPQDAALRATPLRISEVISAGPECKQVRAGDEVWWNANNGNPFPDGDHDLYFLPENHLICITKRGPGAHCCQATD